MADRVGVISRGELIAVDEKKSLMARWAARRSTSCSPTAAPRSRPSFRDGTSRLEDDGHVLCYEFDSHAERTGIASLMRRLTDLGIAYKDLSTHQSSLEDIFVELVHKPREQRHERPRHRRHLPVRDGALEAHAVAEPDHAGDHHRALFRGVRLRARQPHDEMDGVSFGSFIVPGLTLLSVFMQSIFNASFGIYFPKFTGTIYELLSAPISSFEAVLAYVGAAVTKSVILALVTLATAALFVDVRVDHPLAMILFLVGISTGFCLFGFAIGVWAQEFRAAADHPDAGDHAADLPRRRLLFGEGAARAVPDDHAVQPDRPRHQRLPLELLLRRRRAGLVERRSSRSRSSPFAWRSSPGCSGPATASSSKLGRSRALAPGRRGSKPCAVEVLRRRSPS